MVARPWSRKRRPRTVEISPESLHANPYPVYRWLRENAPLAYAPALDGLGLVTRWSDTELVLKDDDRFVTPPEQPPANLPSLGGSLLFVDGQEHARIRSAMQPACQPRRTSTFAAETVAPVADALLDRLEKRGKGELVGGYLEPLAATAVQRLLGVDSVPLDELRRWLDLIAGYLRAEPLPADAEAANACIDACLRTSLQETGTRDGVSLLAVMRAAGLQEDKILPNAKVFAAAGMHELRDLLAHTLLGLLSRPDQLLEVREEPSLVRSALEEGARWASPVGMVRRVTAEDLELAGMEVRAGTFLAAVIASANRDEARWTDPSRFDLHRNEGMHLGFASGVHFCLGAWLARAAGSIALGRLVQRLPRLRLDTSELLVVNGWRFRVVRRLPAIWS